MSGEGRGGQLAEKGSSFTADKRKRIMICKEEKDGVGMEGDKDGETGGRGGEVSEGHGRNKHI